MLEYIRLSLAIGTLLLLVAIAWIEQKRKALSRRIKQAGAPRLTTTPVSKEAPSAVDLHEWAMGVYARHGINPPSPASPLPPTTQALLQALGQQASFEISHVGHCSACKEQPEVVISRFKTLAQAVVDLASTSASEATNSSVAPAPAPATSGSSESSDDSVKGRVVGTALTTDGKLVEWGWGYEGGAWWRVSEPPLSSERIKTYPVRTVTASDPVAPGRAMNEY